MPIPDYTNEFIMVGRLAKYFKGGLSIPEMMKMTFKDVYFWYKIHERQIAEEVILNEYRQNDKPIPEGIALENRIKKKIAEWNNIAEE